MAPQIPDRWEDYKPIGNKIEGTRFIAFKVPLKEHISKSVQRNIRLDGGILLRKIPNLGLIIDLTNTYRYYDPKDFERKGVEYEKLMIPGKEVPPKHLADKFIKIVKKFTENNKNNDKLIGVHCTHGVNRTGYLICNYMITQMTIQANEALKKFANARGHKVERTNYIDNLYKLQNTYGRNSNIKPENWRIRENPYDQPNKRWERTPNNQPSNWRRHHYTQNDNTNFSRSRTMSRDIKNQSYEPYRKNLPSRPLSPPQYSAAHSSRYDRYSYRRPSDHSFERPRNTAAYEETENVRKRLHIKFDF